VLYVCHGLVLWMLSFTDSALSLALSSYLCAMFATVPYRMWQSARVPTFNSLIDNIQRKKYRESLVIVLTVSMILCFFIWWIFLR
jgi:hypothetical protein